MELDILWSLCVELGGGVQVFEAMGDFISRDSFYAYAMPCLAKVAPPIPSARSHRVALLGMLGRVRRCASAGRPLRSR